MAIRCCNWLLVATLVCSAGACERPADDDVHDYTFLQERYNFGVQAADQPARLSAAEAEEDVLVLQSILEDRFAYLQWRGVDHRAAIAAILAGVGDSIDTGDFALQIHKLLTLFGDGHTQVPALREYIPATYLPIALGDSDEGVVAYFADGSGFVDDDYPILTAIDGATIDELLEATSVLVQKGSAQLIRRRSLGLVEHAALWRSELNLPNRGHATLTLTTLDRSSERMVDLDLSEDEESRVWHWLDDARWPHAEYRTLQGDLGYLRIRRMAADDEFVALLHSAMAEFRGTAGLIIDVRGNGGGSRAALMNLFPYLMPPGSSPHITNVAKYRLTPDDEIGDPEGYLDNRYLYPVTSSKYGATERDVITQFAETFQPAWSPPEDSFSNWHYLVHVPRDTTPYYHYDRPVVVLQDEACFSATDIFLSGFKDWPGVTLIGMASGGGSGRTQWYELENSNIPVRISSMASYLVDGQLMDGTGVVPDVVMMPAYTDFARETDTVLNAALELLDGGTGR